ncbi:hypothetical protein ACLMJK_007042 [Lecanora helva]
MSSPHSSEQTTNTSKHLDDFGLLLREDGYVDWKPDEKKHPRYWSFSKKTYNAFLLCFFEFWMTAISSSGTAASQTGRMEYELSRTVGYLVFTSLYLLGQASGSIFCSPISETFGRRTLYIASLAVYCIFCAIVAAVPSSIAVGFGRFITGFASAIPATVAFGSFDDLYDPGTRIWVVYIYTFMGNMGLVLGPIFSAYVSEYAGWRWVFYISTIVSGVGLVASIFLHESRPGYLLELKVASVKAATREDANLRVPEKKHITFQAFVQQALYRPLLFLVTEPIVICCAVLMTISFSLIYGLTEGLTVVYTLFGFNESTTSSLAFIPLLIGLILNVVPRFYDHKINIRAKEQNVTLHAEIKARSLVTACPALAVGLWLFAWTIPPLVPNVHWIVSMLGLLLVGYATNDLSYILFGYLTDTYGAYAASACSALSLSRTIMAAVFPLFTYNMYSGLGGNKATSIFASIATVFCITPVLFLHYGKSLRRMSRFARNAEDAGKEDEEVARKERQSEND